MTETHPFTVESFYKFVSEEKLMAAECIRCGKLHLPPKPMCATCHSPHLKWVELDKKGKLLTYTVIHISPKEFESITPYPVGIIRLEKGLQLLGMIQGIEIDEIEVGMDMMVHFDTNLPLHWPSWPRYIFRPI